MLRRVALNATALFVFVVVAFPVYWMVATAFKQGQDVLSYEPVWLPRDPTLASFRDAISRPYFWSGVRNSLIVVVSVVAVSIVLAFLAALALAKFRFYGRRPFIVVIFAVQMVPLTALIIPLYIALSSVGQVDKLTGVIISYVALVLPFCMTAHELQLAIALGLPIFGGHPALNWLGTKKGSRRVFEERV